MPRSVGTEIVSYLCPASALMGLWRQASTISAVALSGERPEAEFLSISRALEQPQIVLPSYVYLLDHLDRNDTVLSVLQFQQQQKASYFDVVAIFVGEILVLLRWRFGALHT